MNSSFSNQENRLELACQQTLGGEGRGRGGGGRAPKPPSVPESISILKICYVVNQLHMNCVGLRTISAMDMTLCRLKIERDLYAFADALRQVTGMRRSCSSID